jgi:Bacterial regulatory proteins, tetR family
MLRSIAGIVAPPSGPALPCRWQQTDSGWQLPLIITTARKLAEAEGWDAVTTRRLSSQIEYSQPVLYKHSPAWNKSLRPSPSTDSASSPM